MSKHWSELSNQELALTVLYKLEGVFFPRVHYRRFWGNRVVNPEYMFRLLRDQERLPFTMWKWEELLGIELRDFTSFQEETATYHPGGVIGNDGLA